MGEEEDISSQQNGNRAFFTVGTLSRLVQNSINAFIRALQGRRTSKAAQVAVITAGCGHVIASLRVVVSVQEVKLNKYASKMTSEIYSARIRWLYKVHINANNVYSLNSRSELTKYSLNVCQLRRSGINFITVVVPSSNF